MRMKNKISWANIGLGVLSIISGCDFYSTEWCSKYQQPISKIGSGAAIIFGIILLIIELAKFLKLRKNIKHEQSSL